MRKDFSRQCAMCSGRQMAGCRRVRRGLLEVGCLAAVRPSMCHIVSSVHTFVYIPTFSPELASLDCISTKTFWSIVAGHVARRRNMLSTPFTVRVVPAHLVVSIHLPSLPLLLIGAPFSFATYVHSTSERPGLTLYTHVSILSPSTVASFFNE